MEQPPFACFLEYVLVYPSSQIAASLEFEELQALVQVSRAAQQSLFQEEYLKRVIVSSWSAPLYHDIRIQLRACEVDQVKDLSAALTTFPGLTQIVIKERRCQASDLEKLRTA